MPAVLVCQECKQNFNAGRSDVVWCPACREARRKAYQRDYDRHHKDQCPQCGAPKGVRAALCLPCDNKARRLRYQGDANPNWKQGRTNAAGYVWVRSKVGSPGKGKGGYYRPEHNVVWEQHHGHPLPKSWIVHHLNGVKDDNRPENLVAMSRHYHHHHPREALRPYERRIAQLEAFLHANGLVPPDDEMPAGEPHEH